MDAEFLRLDTSFAKFRDVKRCESSKVEAIEVLCLQVICKRSELHSETMVLQEACTKLKNKIEALMDQVIHGGKVLDVPQNVINL